MTDSNPSFFGLAPGRKMDVRSIRSRLAAFARKTCDGVEIDVQEHLQKLVKHRGYSGRSTGQKVFAL